jgi:Zn-dependent M16 (insulinase) family peptidase
LIVTIIWNPSAFQLIGVLPRGTNSTATLTEQKYSSRSQSGDVNKPVAQVEKRSSIPTTHARTHTAAASQEFMEENRREIAIHARYLQDLAPSGFSLFSYVKHCLRGQSFETADKLSLAIDAVLNDIEKWTLHAAFLDWMQRLRQCIEATGEYFEGVEKGFMAGISFAR